MSGLQSAVAAMRLLTQIGITAEQYREATNNPDMTDEQLAEHLASNSDKLRELRDKDH